MAKATDIIAKAVSQIGVKENPANSNKVIYNTEYYGREVSGSAYPWCVTFVWWVFKQCGASNLFCNGKKTASCTYLMNNMASQKVTSPKPGDLVLYQFDRNADADHIGILEKINSDGTYQVIEGNTSTSNDANGGQVMRRTRKKSLVLCFIRPAYEDSGSTGKDDALTTFIKAVQKACGAVVDGIAGSETISKTVTISAKKNCVHTVVKPVQTYLNYLGYNCGAVDGIIGSKTTAAIKAYQKTNGCVVDGEITARNKTWKKLLGMI